MQWKAVLRTSGTVDSVGLNYLQKNVAPVVDEIVVQPGARVTANPAHDGCDYAGEFSCGFGRYACSDLLRQMRAHSR